MPSLTLLGVLGAMTLAFPAWYNLLEGGKLFNIKCLSDPAYWCLLAVMAHSHILYYFIWHWPQRFTALSQALPLRLIGAHPVTVFSNCLVVGKSCQLLALTWYFAPTPAAILGAAPLILAASAACLGMGQLLNVAIYRAIGVNGVYYGFKLGRDVPWCTEFPFNAGVRHPQYTGAMLAYVGLLMLLGSAGNPAAALVTLGVEATLYALTSAMEQAGDNDKAE